MRLSSLPLLGFLVLLGGCGVVPLPRSINPYVEAAATAAASLPRYAPVIAAARLATDQTPPGLHGAATAAACQVLAAEGKTRPASAVLRRAYGSLAVGVLAGALHPASLGGRDPEHVYASAAASTKAADLSGNQTVAIAVGDIAGVLKELIDLSGSGFSLTDLADDDYGARLPFSLPTPTC